jgi:hypothetical protein
VAGCEEEELAWKYMRSRKCCVKGVSERSPTTCSSLGLYKSEKKTGRRRLRVKDEVLMVTSIPSVFGSGVVSEIGRAWPKAVQQISACSISLI